MKFWPKIMFVKELDLDAIGVKFSDRQYFQTTTGTCTIFRGGANKGNILIQICTGRTKRKQLGTLVHELGHWVAFRLGDLDRLHNWIDRNQSIDRYDIKAKSS